MLLKKGDLVLALNNDDHHQHCHYHHDWGRIFWKGLSDMDLGIMLEIMIILMTNDHDNHHNVHDFHHNNHDYHHSDDDDSHIGKDFLIWSLD